MSSHHKQGYSVGAAYNLGDYYLNQVLDETHSENRMEFFLSAKLCYSLPLLSDHEYNNPLYINSSKLANLEEIKVKCNICMSREPKSIPCDALYLIKDFYGPWLKEIKYELKLRSAKHIKMRKIAFMEVFDELTRIYNINKNGFDIEIICDRILRKHHNYIDFEWNGPDFKHLKIAEKNGQILDRLTIIYDKKGYKKRCNNSQEDWFKKYDGEFLAICISEIKQIFIELNISYKIQIYFGIKLLSKKVKFEWSKATSLIPTSWIFGSSCDKLQISLSNILKIEIKEIILKRHNDKRKKREILMDLVQSKYDKICKNDKNGKYIKLETETQKLLIPPNNISIPSQQNKPKPSEPMINIPLSLLTDLCEKVNLYETFLQQLFGGTDIANLLNSQLISNGNMNNINNVNINNQNMNNMNNMNINNNMYYQMNTDNLPQSNPSMIGGSNLSFSSSITTTTTDTAEITNQFVINDQNETDDDIMIDRTNNNNNNNNNYQLINFMPNLNNNH